MSTTAHETTQIEQSALRRAVFAAGMGNALEWFDFSIYSYMAATIGYVFFPSQSESASLLAAFAGFAVAFVVRPLGGLFFGPLGDKIGRSKVLAATILLMSAGTFAVGVLPSFHQIGIWAPVLLIIARMIQGFSTGGEYGGAATYICEYAPDKDRGFLASFLEFGTLGGYVLGAILVLSIQFSLGDAAFREWGWRIPFLTAVPLGLIGLWLRLRLEDSPAFEHMKEHAPEKTPLKELVTNHLDKILLCIGLVIMQNTALYIVLTYLPSYMSSVLEINTLESTGLLVTMMILMMCVITTFGRLSDRFGRKPVLTLACLGYIFLAIPAFMLMLTATVWGLIGALAILGLLTVAVDGIMPSTEPAIFPTHIRYAGFAIAYNISTAMFGGTAPYMVQYLINVSGNELVPGFYLMGAAAIALIAVRLMPETAGKPMLGSRAQVRSSGQSIELS